MSRAWQKSAVLLAAAWLAGCKGQINQIDGPRVSGAGGNPGLPGSPGSGGTGNGGISATGVGGTAGGGFSSGVTCAGGHDAPVVPLRRLTRQEYANSVRDLLGGASVARDDIPADESVGPFASNTVTSVTDLSTQQYLDSAERLGAAAVATPTALDSLVACNRTTPGTTDATCASQFIDRFGARAFRHPLAADEKARYVALYTSYAASGGFGNGIRLVVQAVLQSPNFLYHVELDAAPQPAGTLVALDPYQLAARLSFFLWTSVPDDTLMAAAAGGALADTAAVGTQVARMLQDPRAGDAIATFHTQWLDLAKLAALGKDTTLFPQFTPALRDAMQAETLAFVNSVVRNGDGRLETLLTAPYSILDGPLFALYGVTRPAGSTGPVRVDLDPTQRAGLLTQASFLATHAHENQSSPVARGVAVLRNVLCVALPDPPPNVDNAPPDPKPGATTRERFTAHETIATCAACHKSIDGIGMGFESYDAVGAFRTMDGGRAVDATGNVLAAPEINGPFDGAVALAQKLAGSQQVQQCVARQWFRFALGRLEGMADGCSLKSMFDTFEASHHDVRQLLTAIATSDAFRYRKVGAP
jgi:Protein of unknown function (DUF1592)/Protein of unknown function (DUF1588)/Protein of unknown function (DUF1595)/Protein of unknown function (DUF1585)/Protein of unknown function (DUF1587)